MNTIPKKADLANSIVLVTAAAVNFDRNSFNAKHAESFRDLEGDICDLSAMASLAAREIDDILEEARTGPLNGEGYDRASFAIGHLRQMIDALKQSYYEQFEAGRRNVEG